MIFSKLKKMHDIGFAAGVYNFSLGPEETPRLTEEMKSQLKQTMSDFRNTLMKGIIRNNTDDSKAATRNCKDNNAHWLLHNLFLSIQITNCLH